MRKSSIRTTVLLVIIFGVFLPIIILIVVFGIQYKKQSEEIAKNKATMIAHEYSSDIERILNKSFAVGNVYADVQTSLITDEKQSLSASQLLRNQVEILKKNEQILAMYAIYLPGRIINPNTEELNEYLSIIGNTQYKGNISELIYWQYEFKSNVIDSLKKGDGYFLLPPYQDVYENDTLWMISYIHEIKNGDKIVGVGGVDIGIDWIQSFISKSDIFNDKASIMIVSDKGMINAYSKNKDKVGKLITEELPHLDDESSLLFGNQSNNFKIDDSYVFYEPIEINKLKEKWHIRIQVPESEITGNAQKNLIIRISIALVIGIISLLITYVYFNKIVARIRKLAAVAKRMAKGNLYIDFQIVGNDEITDLGKSLQSIITRFSEIIAGVKSTMEQFRESGNALSTTAVKLSEGASEQASSTQEVSASMEQMSANIEQNAENAKEADKIAQKSSVEIEESSKNVKETAGSMNDIVAKTSIIGDIAFQVNILALNAAVEAARAGAHGKGFGVVANEVGKLADRSKSAALEIDDLTNKSLFVAKKSGKSLEDIVPEIKKTAQLVQDISSASLEQKTGAEQINNAIQQLSQVTQQNASIAENLTTNVEALSSLSDKLNKLISFFKLEARKKRERGEKSGTDKNVKIEKKSVYSQKPPLKGGENQIKEIKQETKKEEVKKQETDTIKNRSKGIDLDLGEDDFLDDGFEKF